MSQPLNPHRPGTEAELVQHLSDTIGNDVMRALDSVSWEHTTMPPTAPKPEDTPTGEASPARSETDTPPPIAKSEPTGSEATTAFDFEKLRDPETGLIMRKWKTGYDAVAGVHSILHTTSKALDERDNLSAEVSQLRQQLSSLTTQGSRADAPESPRSLKLDALLAKVKEGGLDADDLPTLVEAVSDQASLNAQEMVRREKATSDAENSAWMEVDSYMSTKHPAAMNHADEMTLFKRTNPDVGRVFDRFLASGDSTSKLDATLYLWDKFSQANPHVLVDPVDPAKAAQDRNLQIQGQIRQEEVDASRRDAGLLGTSAGGAHEATGNVGPSREDVDEAGRYMRQTGNGQAWRNMTITPTLNSPFFD